ncbi:hypothetical protein TcasGA2_TC032036 [Tribolium castaneum]|uniref:Uncharacterized protein n=1 Tax=Tribolium castaneum TaxID=7070 RepID=A0A139WM91_TRICA|nr:hypothetical protein TcasGA2_TC032036 [Tribolium castaneum]
MVTPQPREFPMISEVLQKGQRIKNLRAIGHLTTNWKKIGESPSEGASVVGLCCVCVICDVVRPR